MRYPKAIKAGDSLGLIAPSFGCNIEPYHSALKAAITKFEAMGYRVILGENAFAGAGVGISNTPEACGAELNAMFARPEVGAVLSCGGGELMCEVVPYMDFDAIAAAPPKWFMGYSDNTNFTFLSATLADTAAVYGPCAPSFGMDPWHRSLEDAFGLLTGGSRSLKGYGRWERESLRDEEHPCVPYNLDSVTEYRLFGDSGGEARMSGRLLGGCLDLMRVLLGTRFDRVSAFCERYREDGILWFLESCDLTVFDIRRTLWSMREAGWLDTARGFLFGRPLHWKEEVLGLDQYAAVIEPLRGLNVPIVMDADLGHLPPALPLVTGALAELRATRDELAVELSFR